MCEGPSSISGPIPPDPTLVPQHYKQPASARGRIEGNYDRPGPLLSGPVAPDHVLYPGYYSARIPVSRFRISPNATHIVERGRKGVVGDLLNLDSRSPTPPVPKLKKRVFDFGKENIRQLREIQRRCKEQEAKRTQSHPVKALWTSSKYDNVSSRVMTQPQIRCPVVRPQCQNFLKAHSNGVQKQQSRTSPRPLQRQSSFSSTRKKDLQLQVQGEACDFVKQNAKAAGKTVLRRSHSLTDVKCSDLPRAAIGQVPRYLEERKEQWRKEEDERIRNQRDPSIPPGHSLMPESERVETLKTLNEAHRSLVSELLSLPFKDDTLRIRSRRANLDCRLYEIEEAIKIFSREKVYVKTDS